MEYWHGQMNWPVIDGWSCWACGSDASILEWGFVNGECRCGTCGVHYYMRDANTNKAVDTPISWTLPNYVEPFKRIWNESRTHIDDVTDEMWDKAGAA